MSLISHVGKIQNRRIQLKTEPSAVKRCGGHYFVLHAVNYLFLNQPIKL